MTRQTFDASEQTKTNDDGSSTIRLRYPIQDGSQTIESLTVRRPKAKHLKAMDSVQGDVGKELRLMEELTGQTMRVLGEMEAEDFSAVDEVIKGYMGKSRATGGTP